MLNSSCQQLTAAYSIKTAAVYHIHLVKGYAMDDLEFCQYYKIGSFRVWGDFIFIFLFPPNTMGIRLANILIAETSE